MLVPESRSPAMLTGLENLSRSSDTKEIAGIKQRLGKVHFFHLHWPLMDTMSYFKHDL